MASSIGRRYAQAYFDLALQAKQVKERREDLVRALETLTNPEVADALANPRLTLSERSRLALDLLDGVGEPVRNLVRLLLQRNRTSVLGDLLQTYDALTDRESGVMRADVTTAVPVDADLTRHITRALGRSSEPRCRPRSARTPTSSAGWSSASATASSTTACARVSSSSGLRWSDAHSLLHPTAPRGA